MQNLRSFPQTCVLRSMAFLTLSGCKVEIKVPQGGTVKSTDGAYVCEAGQICVIDVVDLFFDETFIAEPASGYSFGGWIKKDRYLYGGATTPCRLATAGFEDNPALQDVLESDQKFYLMPVFLLKLGCPEPELVLSPGPITH